MPSRPRIAAFLLCPACLLAAAMPAVGSPRSNRSAEAPARSVVPVQRWSAEPDGSVVARLDEDQLGQAALFQTVELPSFPLPQGGVVDLRLRRFYVTGPQTQFVIGRKGAADVAMNFDPDSIALFRGEVVGRPNSSVFLALRDFASTGAIRVDGQEFAISSVHPSGATLQRGLLSVFRPRLGGGLPGPICGTDTLPNRDVIGAPSAAAINGAESVAGGAASSAVLGGGPTNFAPNRIRRIELAVDTDHEYFELFGDATEAAAYLVQMYGAISDIYLRDLGVYFDLTYVRVWDSAIDLYNSDDPLFDITVHWQNEMGHVPRDLTQLISGRRDYAYGGIAWLSSTCEFDFGYNAVGYINGSFPDPTRPHIYNYDVHVSAHELGHNAGTLHTQDYGLDACHNPGASSPRRGSIMSYCSQTWSGGNANTDNDFHVVTRNAMYSHLDSVLCLQIDCNMNGVSDELDVLKLASLDANGNGIPDECEDCNNNGILDPADIAGSSSDVNGNGVPDECESDCNDNGLPDSYEMEELGLTDTYGNGVPDICEPNCNGNGTADYNEIQANMSLDIDRNVQLDACQDCDSDSQSDIAELGGAHDMWIASGLPNERLRRFYATTGVRDTQSPSAGAARVQGGQDVLITGDGRVLVSSAADDRVMQFNLSGAYLGDLVATGAGGLDHPTGLAIASSGLLLVASHNGHSVLAYDAASGDPQGAFVAAASGGLNGPHSLVYSPQGHLLVAGSNNQVFEYDGTDGSFRRVFVRIQDNGGLNDPRGMTFKPDGNLLVASWGNNLVLEYDGVTGLPMSRWAKVGTAEILNLVSPWGVRVGPNGNVFISRTSEDFGNPDHDNDHDHDDEDTAELHLTQARVYEFDVRNGNFIRTYVAGNDHGLNFATAFDFIPGWAVDCNWNQMQDSCDIASGASLDVNTDNIPDECQLDCNGNQVYDRLDIIPHGASLDCNYNGVPDECDLADATSTDVNGNDRPDECDGLRFDSAGTAWTRYLSFQTPSAAAAGISAMKVTIQSAYVPSPPDASPPPSLSGYVGQVRWVGPPTTCSDHLGSYLCATLQCTPHYQDWSSVGLIYATGDAIMPSSAYAVQIVPQECQGIEGSCGKEGSPLVLRTGRWGDIFPPYQNPTLMNRSQPDVIDIGTSVDALKALATSVPRFQAQLAPSAVDPQTPMTVIDLGFVVDAVKGFAYPFNGPETCP